MKESFLQFFLLFLFFVKVVNGSWVDPDTPYKDRIIRPLSLDDDRRYKLVFSDEFEQEGRTFHDGRDPRWTAINKNDYTNLALHYYSHDNAITTNGVLNITTERKVNLYKAFNEKTKQFYADKKYIQSAMVQGWNKFCFTGGIVEFSAKLPGNPSVGGLWPALWMLGNLARATYVGSSDYVWPYSYNKCDQRHRMSQKISACSKLNHYGMAPEVGRGAPEIDIIEAMQGEDETLPSTTIRRPYQSCSLQVAPGVQRDRPILGLKPKKGHWYSGMEYNTDNETKSELNPFFYGVTLVHKPKLYTYQADALSANTGLDKSFYETQHKYRVEWDPPESDGSGGYIRWYTDDIFVYGITGDNLNITGTEIPREAMYLLMNTAVASSWGFPTPCPDGCECDCFECGNPDCECALPTGYCENFPASFEIDYVRVYQATNEPKHTLSCSPEERPTALYIEGHREKYMEAGDRQPILPVRTGGASCADDVDCGGSDGGDGGGISKNGKCSPTHKICVCAEGYTGPSCLAHAGFYDHEFPDGRPTTLGWSKMYLPKGLIIIMCILVLGFLILLVNGIKNRIKNRRYRRISSSAAGSGSGGGRRHHNHHHHHHNNNHYNHNMHSPHLNSTTYQNSAEYALPPQQKVVTYCVIDGRLVDESLMPLNSTTTTTSSSGATSRRSRNF